MSSQQKLSRDMLIKNLRAMKIPTQLLKFGATGKPKFRKFRLTADHKYLEWESKSKSLDQTRVALEKISRVIFGQRTEKFRKHNRLDLDPLSFSLIYKRGDAPVSPTSATSPEKKFSAVGSDAIVQTDEETLDLVCKDEKEFLVWAKTFLAIIEKQVDEAVWAEVDRKVPASSSAGTLNRDASRVDDDFEPNEAMTESNDVYTFGWGEWGQHGMGSDMVQVKTPKLIELLLGKGVTQVACGWSNTTVVLDSGVILQCGNRLATGLDADMFTPAPTALPQQTVVTQVACGSFHTAAITESGELLTWGSNFHGQLGHGDTVDSKTPKFVQALRGQNVIIKVRCGSEQTAVLGDDATVYTWGCGAHGALAHNDTQDKLVPTMVEELNGAGVVKISAGNGFMFACTERETYAWGNNACGQLGLGHTEDQLRPHVVEGLRGYKVIDLACGAAHTVAVVKIPKLDQQVLFSWGSNCCGQLGQEKKTEVLKPHPLTLTVDLKDDEVTEVACGDLHTCIKTNNGKVLVCGSNAYGQLGLGSTQDVHEPTLIPSFADKEVRAVQCGGQHTTVLAARTWLADHEAKECMNCKNPFTFTNRRHHCRSCGGIFCNSCSNKKSAILKYGFTSPVRVCDSCYIKLQSR